MKDRRENKKATTAKWCPKSISRAAETVGKLERERGTGGWVGVGGRRRRERGGRVEGERGEGWGRERIRKGEEGD